jgi:hypothetical protein
MFDRIRTGWSLTMQSMEVLKADKELLLFPLMSGISLVLVTASFLVPVFTNEALMQSLESDVTAQEPVFYAVLFLFYFVNYFIIMFFNAALIGCAIIRFDGRNPTLADGFRTSMQCLPQIFGWALVSATVGVILRIIESRSETVGKIIAALIGTAWNITTYFVLPVLVVEKVGPVEAFKRSAGIIKRTWGEALTANIGIGIIVFILMCLACLPVVFGIMAGTETALLIGITLTVAGIILVSLISSVLGTIITAALYEYAGYDRVPEQFDKHLLEQAFTHKE